MCGDGGPVVRVHIRGNAVSWKGCAAPALFYLGMHRAAFLQEQQRVRIEFMHGGSRGSRCFDGCVRVGLGKHAAMRRCILAQINHVEYNMGVPCGCSL